MNSVIYQIEKTKKTPSICFDPNSGKLEINGSSLPDDSYKFYEPLLELIDFYLESPQQKTELHFQISYFNTSSSKILLQLLQKFDVLFEKGLLINAFWYYDDEDQEIYEAGQTYRSSIKIPLHIKAFALD